MNYSETIDYLFNALPVFQHQGGSAYKPGLERVEQLLSLCGDPHKHLKTIHIAGTNGKGSTSHLLASILQASGLRVGLFTSPHLVDFRERIRINGAMIDEDYVVRFVKELRVCLPEELQPSFFEFTTAMAMAYFEEQQVDIAVIEVGMGGRLDSTNVITPLVSVITNVSIDHAAYLGSTLAAIATEKVGIIKENVPVVLGRSHEEAVRSVVTATAELRHAPLYYADQMDLLGKVISLPSGIRQIETVFGEVLLPLPGAFQLENLATVLAVVQTLQQVGIPIAAEACQQGIAQVAATGLRGRLQVLQEQGPRVLLDTGHNVGAWVYLSAQLREWAAAGDVVCLMGMAADKEVSEVLRMLPREGVYYLFCNAQGLRALPSQELYTKAIECGITTCLAVEGTVYDGYQMALALCREQGCETLFVGGSNFVVGELIASLQVN